MRSAKEKQGLVLGHFQFWCFYFEEVSGFNTAHGACEEEGHNNVLEYEIFLPFYTLFWHCYVQK